MIPKQSGRGLRASGPERTQRGMSEKKSKKIADGRFSRLCRMGPVKKVVAALEAGGGETMEWTWTPLMRWVAHWDDCERRDGLTVDVVRALIGAGADVNARNGAGDTALMQAAYYRRRDVAALLLDAGADVNAQDDFGQTALMSSAHKNPNAEVMGALIDAGAELDARDCAGRTALIRSVMHDGSKDYQFYSLTFNLLLDAGADPHIVDDEGKRAIDYARENRDLKWWHERDLQRLEEISRQAAGERS